MLLQQLNRSDAEQVFIVATNTSGATISQNQLFCFDFRATNSLGNAVASPITSNLGLFAGVANAQMAANDFNLVQVYGYRASIAAHVGAASVSAAGLILGPLAGNLSAQSTGRSFGLGPIVCFNNDLSGETYVSGFIRAL